MAVSILRTKQLCALLSVGKTKLDEDFIYKPGGSEYVPNTNDSVKRLRLVELGERSKAAFSNEVDGLIEELRAFRDAQYASGKALTPKQRAPRRKRKQAAPAPQAAATAEAAEVEA